MKLARLPCAWCGALTSRRDDEGDPACDPDECGKGPRERSVPQRLEYRGEARTIPELARLAGVPYRVIHARLGLGWGVAQAVETPLGTHGGPRPKRAD